MRWLINHRHIKADQIGWSISLPLIEGRV